MGVYDRQIANAQRAIKAKGRACVWRAIANDAPTDTSKPWKPGAVDPTDYPVNILFLPEGRSTGAFLRALGGTDIQVGEDYGLMGAVSFVPTTRAEIYAEDGTTLLRTVMVVETLAPNGENILHTLRFGVEG